MKVLFIYPSDNQTFNAGIGYLSAVLKQNHHQTRLYMTNKFTSEELSRELSEFAPDLIAVSSVTNQFPLARLFITQLKRMSGKPVIMGGVHATIAPDEAIQTEGLDAICVGEGEQALLEFVNCLEKGKPLTSIPNIWYKEGSRIHKNPLRPLIADLDALPTPDYSIFNYSEILNEMGVLMIFANRGCPFNCKYCINHYLQKIYDKKKFVRMMTVDGFIKNIRRILDQYPEAKILEFFDEAFMLDKSWLKEFAGKYPQAVGKPYYCNVHAGKTDATVVRMLKDSGCVRVNIALETGDEHLRQKILNKPISNEDLKRTFFLFREAGIRTYAHNMIGIPHETEENIIRTIQFNQDLQVDDLQCWVFYPYPGSDSYKLCKKNQWISDRNPHTTVAGKITLSILNQPGIDYERVSYYFRTFKYQVLGEKTPDNEVPLEYMAANSQESQLISGWNNLEDDQGLFFRWTKEDGRLYFRNSGKRLLSILANFLAPPDAPRMTLRVNQKTIASFVPEKNKWQWYEFKLPTFKDPLLEVSIQSENICIPAHYNITDYRHLGLAVSRVQMENWLKRKRRQWNNEFPRKKIRKTATGKK